MTWIIDCRTLGGIPMIGLKNGPAAILK